MSNGAGTLFVVATPIGNLGDITARAVDTLAAADRIAAEDTRHTAGLLRHLGLQRPLLSLHEHNEDTRIERIVACLERGENIALVSDAGTPLISDPGFRLVRALRLAGHQVTPVPGACSIIAALSAAGLASDRFVYEGFLPAKNAQRQRRLEALASEPRTLVCLESGHRIAQALADMAGVFGGQREGCVARELTKRHETLCLERLERLADWVAGEAVQRRGEFVVLVAGAPEQPPQAQVAVQPLLQALAAELPPRRAAQIVARLTGDSANRLYRRLTVGDD